MAAQARGQGLDGRPRDRSPRGDRPITEDRSGPPGEVSLPREDGPSREDPGSRENGPPPI